MRYCEDKKTGNSLSVLGLGCMRFPSSMGAVDMRKTEKIILAAVEKGINYYDTAYIYPGSEETLGAVLAKHGLRGRVNIATKMPVISCRGPEDFDKIFARQLDALKTDYVDYYLMHMLSDCEFWDKLRGWGIEKWIEGKKKEGKIRRVGFSFHGKVNDFLSLLDVYDWEFCQIQYNYFDENYQAGVTGLKRAAAKGLPVIVMEPLLGGKLATGLPREAVKIFREARAELSPAAWALKWLWNQPEVTVVLSGMASVAVLEDNVSAAAASEVGSLTPEEEDIFRKVREVFRASYKIPCTGCAYCMPCPHRVNIPACFSSYNAVYSMGYILGIQLYITSGGAGYSGSASLCTRCGACEKHCPQQIPIRDSLEAVRKRLEPFWYKWAMPAVRFFLWNRK